jgi:WD40 repeat protein
MLAAGAHDAYPTTQVLQTSGLAWVASDQIGSLTLLDGVAGQPVAQVPAAQVDGNALIVGQDGANGLALDQASGLLTRVDGSSYTPTSIVEPSTGSNVQFLVGAHTAYVVDDADSTADAYDLTTLSQIGGTFTFAQGASSDTAVIDASDRLWILDQDTGRLLWFTGSGDGSSAEVFGRGGASVVLADGEPVVVDTDARRASLIAPDGAATERLDLPAGSSVPGTGYSGATARSTLLITDSAQGTYQSCTMDLGTCGPAQHAAFDGDTLGPAVITAGRAFVPDYTSGTLWVLDPGDTAAPVHTGTVTAAGEFDLFDRGGMVFYNDPDTSQAGTVAPDGTTRPIVKYSSGAAGIPSASASAAATPSASASAAPSPTRAVPTHSPAKPTQPATGSSGKPTPIPTPSNTGGGGTYCTASAPTSSSTSPSAFTQGVIAMSNSENSEPQSPSSDERPVKARSEYKPQYIIAAIGAAGAVIAAVAAAIVALIIPELFPTASQPSASSSTSSSASAHVSVSASSTAQSAAAVGASMPANPTFTVQDPNQGRGVYGVEFLSDSALAVGDLNGSVYLWDLDNGTNTAQLPDQNGQEIFGLAYDPQDGILAADTLTKNYQQGSVVLWNASTHAYLTTLTTSGKAGFGNPPVFSPDGSTVAADSNDTDIYLWSATTYKPVGTPMTDPGGDGDYGLAYSPSTGYLAAADHNGTAYLWDTQHDRLVQTFVDTTSGNVVSVAFNSDGSLLATGDSLGDVELWNVSSGALIATLHGVKGGTVPSIAFSPTKPIVAATIDADHTSEFCIWSTAGKLLDARQDPGTTYTTKLAFSPDGDTLAVGDQNVKTYIWNVSGVD